MTPGGIRRSFRVRTRCTSGKRQEFQGPNQVYYWEESGVSGSESGVLLGRIRCEFRVESGVLLERIQCKSQRRLRCASRTQSGVSFGVESAVLWGTIRCVFSGRNGHNQACGHNQV